MSTSEQGSAQNVPDYLRRWGGLYVHDGDRLVEAPAEDQAVARGYPEWPDKGPVVDGNRLTIMTKKVTYRVDEEVRIIHVVEVVEPGRRVYIMGPKPAFGEYVDDRLATEPPRPGEDPLVPSTYNGVTLPSPAVDYNYDITSYKFSAQGTHQIYWKLGSLQSNVLNITIQ